MLAFFVGCTKDDETAPSTPPANTTTTGGTGTTTGGTGTTTGGTGTTTGGTGTTTGGTGTTTGGTGTTTGGTTTGGTTGSVSNNLDKTVMLNLVNAARTSGCNCGATYMQPVKPVSWNDKLEQAAVAHSQDMLAKGIFSHTGSDGSNPGTRITRAGYQWMAYGENIARGYADEKAVVDGWLKSEGHCKNIMSGSFTEMGVAHVSDYWTQEFGRQ